MRCWACYMSLFQCFSVRQSTFARDSGGRFTANVCALSSEQLYSLVTASPASMLRLNRGEGAIRPGASADLIAVRDRQGDPAEVLSALTSDDIELVLLSGRVQLASASIFERLS